MRDISQDTVKELLDYNPESGIFTWRHRDRKWFSRDNEYISWNNRYAGKTAGCVSARPTGYRHLVFSIFGRLRIAHRVAWLYMEGYWPSFPIDHINHDATDNRWDNLRRSTPLDNQRNKSMHKNNTSGISGVYYDKARKKWVARIRMGDGKRVSKRFGYDDLDLAAMEALEMMSEAGFDASHGMQLAPYHKELVND